MADFGATLARIALVIVIATLTATAPLALHAYSFGAGTCDAVADGNFMAWKTHHPGDNGGFAVTPDRIGFYAGEVLELRLAHATGELFVGFLLYAEDALDQRQGGFDPVPGTTFSGGLPVECSHVGHTITHDDANLLEQLRLHWAAPSSAPTTLTLRALVLRADPIAQQGTDFYEVALDLPFDPEGVFRNRFEGEPTQAERRHTP
jgi:hypothetical protein